MYKYTSNPDRAIALADCNNFFASCERRVNPLLENRPVVVLSCNDGCVIARSNEVKKIGIKMGEPYFRIKDTLKYYNVAVRSTNMPLYQEVSAEVMARIKIYTDAIEQYSIDECFFNMGIANITDPVAYCLRIRKDILCKCRIPVSIGIAPTKTLCKLAAEYAKHHDDSGGVYWLSSEKYNDYDYMSQFKCGDVWGIGNKTEKKLALQGVRNAAEFTRLDEVAYSRSGSYVGVLLFRLNSNGSRKSRLWCRGVLGTCSTQNTSCLTLSGASSLQPEGSSGKRDLQPESSPCIS